MLIVFAIPLDFIGVVIRLEKHCLSFKVFFIINEKKIMFYQTTFILIFLFVYPTL